MEPLLLQKLQNVMRTLSVELYEGSAHSLRSFSAALSTDNLQNLLLQDSVLCAAGRMSRALMDQIKLDQILTLLQSAIGSNSKEYVHLSWRLHGTIG